MQQKPVRFLVLLLGAALIFLTSVRSMADINEERKAQETIMYYLDLLRSENFVSAMGLWEPSCLEQSLRMGIEYDGIPIKADCRSPFVYDYENMKRFLPDAIASKAVLDSTTFRWKLDAKPDSGKISYFYYTTLVDGYYWIVPPHYYYSRDWPVRETEYFRFIINPERMEHYNEVGARALDEAVETMAAELHVPPEKIAMLAEKKIDYYLCKDGFEVENLSGVRDGGVYTIDFDAVITCFFPHYHKVALLMINLKLERPPLFTIPFMRDGMATSLGGRWQRAPEVVYDFGDYIMKYDIVRPDSILTYGQYNDATAGDVTSPVGACLSRYIYQQFGDELYFDLYRKLSGDYESVVGLTPGGIQQTAASILDMDWSEIKTGFADFMEKRRQRRGLIHPGETETDRALIDSDGLRLSMSDKWIKVEYRYDSTTANEVNLLFGKDEMLEESASMLFDEQYKKKRAFEGYRYGLRMDKNEIGLYDYAVNQIKAKFIDDPGTASDYYNSAERKITAYFNLNLVENIVDITGDYRILK